MAILAIFTGNNVTKQMYEALRKEVDWEHNHPAGVILHAAGFDESGNNVRVADIWESEEDLNNFVSSRFNACHAERGGTCTKGGNISNQ